MNLPYFLLKGQMFSLAMDLVGLVRSLPVLLSSISCMWILLGVIQMGRRRQWHPTPVLLPGKSYGRRSLVGCSPWGREESDMTERLHFHFSLSCIGGRNGNPFQYSCLENPRDSGAWWAAVYGITQSWTQLNRLRSIQMGTGWTIAVSGWAGAMLESNWVRVCELEEHSLNVSHCSLLWFSWGQVWFRDGIDRDLLGGASAGEPE